MVYTVFFGLQMGKKDFDISLCRMQAGHSSLSLHSTERYVFILLSHPEGRKNAWGVPNVLRQGEISSLK